MSKSRERINYIITGAIIAALYVDLTFLSNIFNLAFGPVQFRVSEVLTILPVFTSAAIPGVAVGCFIANIASFNPLDMIFGTSATVIAALLTYFFYQGVFRRSKSLVGQFHIVHICDHIRNIFIRKFRFRLCIS